MPGPQSLASESDLETQSVLEISGLFVPVFWVCAYFLRANAIVLIYLQVLASLDHSFSQQAATTGKPGDLDEVKRTLLETNIWLLLTTGAVSILHMLFEMLAFTSGK